jgi:hypothetical protein
MLRWRNISLHWRLMLLTMASSAVGMTVAMTLLFIYSDRRIREDKVEELRSAADLIGTNSAAALAFEDVAECSRLLQALQTRRHIVQGVLYRGDGVLVVQYQRSGLRGGSPEQNNPSSELIRWKSDSLELSRAAHTIKGMLRNLSMGAAAETAAKLEASSYDALHADSSELLNKLVRELDHILPEVEAQLAGVRS